MRAASRPVIEEGYRSPNRLKGLLVYPAIVTTLALALSVFLALMLSSIRLDSEVAESVNTLGRPWVSGLAIAGLWAPPVFNGVALASMLSILFVPSLKQSLTWQIRVFHEAKLADSRSRTVPLFPGPS